MLAKKISLKKTANNVMNSVNKLKILELFKQKEEVRQVVQKFHGNESTVRSFQNDLTKICRCEKLKTQAFSLNTFCTLVTQKIKYMLLMWIQDLEAWYVANVESYISKGSENRC